MNATVLNQVPDTKGSKNGQNGADQFNAACKRENANLGASKKTVYLKPSKEDKIDAFFKYQFQQDSRRFEMDTLERAIIAKYSEDFGVDFCRRLFACCNGFTREFTMDIVTKVADNDNTAINISYMNGENTVARYLVKVDEPNVCSVFRHFLEYAKATGHNSVAALIEAENKVREANRKAKAAEKKEAKEAEKVGQKLQEMSIEKLLSMLSPEQVAALVASQTTK